MHTVHTQTHTVSEAVSKGSKGKMVCIEEQSPLKSCLWTRSWIQRRASITYGLPLYTVEKLFLNGTNLSCLGLNKQQVRCWVENG